MGDDRLPLADVNTEHVEVIQGLQTWIRDFVTEFGVDGLRIDGGFQRSDQTRFMRRMSSLHPPPSQLPNTFDPSFGNLSVQLLACSVSAKSLETILRESWSVFATVIFG